MKSIRGRLIARLLLAWLALLVVGELTLEFGLESYLLDEMDEALLNKAHTLATLVFDRGDSVEFEFADELMPEFSAHEDPEYFEIVYEDGTLVERSRSLGRTPLPGISENESSVTRWTLELPDGRSGRGVAFRAPAHYEPRVENETADAPRDSPVVIVRVARSREELERVVMEMQRGLEAVMFLLAVAVTFTVTRAVRRGLEPLARLGAAVAAIDDRTPKLEFLDGSMPSELQPIRERLEGLLARLGEALERERRFTSSAAHELCTPITELRAMTEVALHWPEEPEQGRKRLHDTLAIAIQMEKIVSILMAIARAESDRFPVAPERIGVENMLEEILREHAETISSKSLRVSRDLDADLEVESDVTRFQGLVRNLVDNAVEYAPEGGEIRFAAHVSGSHVRIVVTNTDFALTPEDVSRLTEPFWRKDSARSDREHVGLGLSLAAAYGSGISGELSFDLADHLLHARLTIPLRLSRTGQGDAARTS